MTNPPGLGRLASGVLWGAYALVLLLTPLVLDSSLSQTLLAQMGITIIACLSFNLLLGQGGMLSFGHAVYTGMGAFLAMHTLNRVSAGWPLPVSLVPLVGGVGSLLLALLLGWVTTRKSGTAFAMITFGMGELVWALALVLPDWFGGEAGVSGNRVSGSVVFGISLGPQRQLNVLICFYTLVCTWLMFAFTQTPLGRMLNAVRDNAERVAFVGYDPHRVRFLAFVVSSFFAGVAGGLAALNFELVTADVLSAQRSGAYLLFTVLGGTGYFVGPIIGAVLMVLSFVLLSSFTKAWLLYVGLMFVGMVMLAPGGVAALVMAQVRLLRQQGAWRALGGAYLAVLLAAAVALAGLVALVEMLYHLQQLAALGPVLPFGGVQLDVQQAGSWMGAGLLLLTGLACLRVSYRQWVRRHQGWLSLRNAPDTPGTLVETEANGTSKGLRS